MTFYDDADVSCPRCSLDMDAADLCEHEDPMCARCCTVEKHEDELYAAWLCLGFTSEAVA
ncbi:hypothetical protein LRP67_16405 [Nocardioides sp. cx-169]|uniref:hypothetical protein n=1 Tax=Nocardioides sp. cx-169 TaxID=2899080 RepID=UPI001E64B21E|nr:hypothetical protein [Nocardioides sp. cx-169]MCD4535676.1 hypothetical protein [Nocardioides sp. cx-169]